MRVDTAPLVTKTEICSGLDGESVAKPRPEIAQMEAADLRGPGAHGGVQEREQNADRIVAP